MTHPEQGISQQERTVALPNPDRLLTSTEVQQLLSIRKSQFHLLVKAGRIPVGITAFGGRRWRASDIFRLIADA
ncbi:hypothetical protein CDEF62S_03617 [Castellaniella defragrans]|jgi:predicted DNA-binding transcriptional regulator AlpA